MGKHNFFIVGAAKCGTTAMHEYLTQHPDVFMSKHKEPHFFGSDLDWHNREPMSSEYYSSLFDEAQNESVVGESSVFYLYSTRAAQEIHQYAPKAKILIMLRNPVDVIYSFHNQRLLNGTEDIDDFAEALAAEQDRREGRRLPRQIGLRQGLFYRDLGRFDSQVERFQSVFPREQICFVIYDDFRRNTASVYREVVEFLGLEPSFEPAFDVINPNAVNRNPGLQRLMTAPPSVFRSLLRALLPSRALRLRIGSFIREWNSRVARRPDLAGELRSQLQIEFEDSIENLGGLIGRDLTDWKAMSLVDSSHRAG
jgi:hypothetical protein